MCYDYLPHVSSFTVMFFIFLSSFRTRRSENLNDASPLSEDYPGSGSGSGSGSGFLSRMEEEYQPVDNTDAFYYNLRSLRSDYQDLGQDGPEENFII